MSTTVSTVFAVLAGALALVSAIFAIQSARGRLGKELTARERRWDVANNAYWSLFFIVVLIAIFNLSHDFEMVMRMALGGGLLFDLSMPGAARSRLYQHWLVSLVAFLAGVGLFITGLAGLV